jgi:hypothetical protein
MVMPTTATIEKHRRQSYFQDHQLQRWKALVVAVATNSLEDSKKFARAPRATNST